MASRALAASSEDEQRPVHNALDQLPAPYWVAHTQLAYADLLRDVGNADRATRLVDQALETAKTFGFAALESRAAAFPA